MMEKPFELATSEQPQAPHSLSAMFEEKNLGAYHMAKEWEDQHDIAKFYLDNVAR